MNLGRAQARLMRMYVPPAPKPPTRSERQAAQRQARADELVTREKNALNRKQRWHAEKQAVRYDLDAIVVDALTIKSWTFSECPSTRLHVSDWEREARDILARFRMWQTQTGLRPPPVIKRPDHHAASYGAVYRVREAVQYLRDNLRDITEYWTSVAKNRPAAYSGVNVKAGTWDYAYDNINRRMMLPLDSRLADYAFRKMRGYMQPGEDDVNGNSGSGFKP